MRAQMPPTSEAVATASTDHMSFAADNFTGMKVDNIRADLDDFAHELMTDNHWHGNSFLCPLVPIVDMDIGAANSGPIDTNQHVIDADCRFGHLVEPKPRFRLLLNKCFHGLRTFPRMKVVVRVFDRLASVGKIEYIDGHALMPR